MYPYPGAPPPGGPSRSPLPPAPPHSRPFPPRQPTTAGSWADAPAARSSIARARLGGAPGEGRPPDMPLHPTRIAVPVNPRPTLFVNRLPAAITEADLRATFSPYGALTRVTIKPPLLGSYTTFAHIGFRTPQEATAAYQALDGRHPTLLTAATGAGLAQGMRIEYAQTDEEREAARRAPPAAPAPGLFRVPQTPEPSQAAAAAAVKPEPEPSPHRAPPAAGARVPLQSQAMAHAQDAPDAPKKRGKKRKGNPAKSRQWTNSEDALKIVPPAITYDGAPLVSLGYGFRKGRADDCDVPRVTYLCKYRLPASLPKDKTAPTTAAFVTTARDELRARGIGLDLWDVLPPQPDKGHPDALLAIHLVIPPEQVVELSRDPYEEANKRTELDARTEERRQAGAAASTLASASASTSAAPTPVPIPAPAPQPTPAADPSPDGALTLTLPLPATCLGPTPAAGKARRAWLGAQARAMALEGKAVLATRFDEVKGVCEVRYLPPEEEGEEGEGGEELVAGGVANGTVEVAPQLHLTSGARGEGEREVHPPPPPPAAAVQPAPAPMEEDVKPVIPPPSPAPAPAPAPVRGPPPAQRLDGDGDGEVDQLATQTPEPEGVAAGVRRYPLRMLSESRADSKETLEVVDSFIKEYFRRFDESRGTLEYLYTPNALFSLKLDPTVPARLRNAPHPFEPRWLLGANRLSSTPVAITNAIRALPPGSHDLSRMVFTAQSVPELHVRKQARAPILLHLVGEFEEFPDKTVRGFARTFIIVPKSAAAGGRAPALDGSGEYWIHSDQLTIRYHVPGEPRALPVAYPPFSPAKARAAAPAPALPAPLPVAGPSRAQQDVRPFAQFEPHPALARMRQPAVQPGRTPALASEPALAHEPALAPAPTVQRQSAPAPPRQPVAEEPPPPAPPQPAAQQKKRLRVSSASPGVAPALGADNHDVDMDGDVLILSDSSASRSPELQRKRRAPPSPDRDGAGAAKRRVSGPEVVQAARAVAAQAEGTLSRAELERLIQAEVAAQVQRLAGAAGRAVSPRSDAEEPAPGAIAGTAGKKRTKERTQERAAELVREREEARRKTREREREKEKEKDRKEKARREREKVKEPELGPGLGRTDARIILPGGGNAQLHGFDGRSNKLRHMVDTGNSFLAVSLVGDIVEFACTSTTLSSTVRKVHSSKDDKYRVDDFAWSGAKDTLLVGYLGAKEGRELVRPPSQVILYRREESATGSTLTPVKLAQRPHTSGGVTAISTLPGSGRLRFITGGEDKKLFLWTRSRASQEIKTENIRSEHSSMITSIAQIEHQDWVVSGGKDKRVFAYDLDRMASTWQALLNYPVMTVSQVTSDPHLILARVAAPSSQFTIFDIRSSKKGVLTFGYDLAPHPSASGALAATNMGRYFRGDQCDKIYAFPDYETGVKLWDLRNVRETLSDHDLKKQHLPGLGRSRVVQTAFRGRGELCLMEMAHFSRLSIRG